MVEETQTLPGAAAEPGLPPLSARQRVVVEALAVVSVWATFVVVLSNVPSRQQIDTQKAALFGHLVALIVGFGGVIMVDIYGALWILGRRSALDVARLASAGHWLILTGLMGLLGTGAMLHPDLSKALPWLKMVLVLVVMLNGLNAHHLQQHLKQLPARVSGADIPWWVVPRGLATALVSQGAWWGCIAIGFATSMARAR